MNNEERKQIEQEILKHKASWDNRTDFIWAGDTVHFCGSLAIHSEAKFSASQLTSIGGNVYVHSEAKFSAPQLTSVGGGVYIYREAEFSAPQLTSIGGDAYVHSKAEFPQLTSVGGHLDVYREAEFSAPQLKNKGFIREMRNEEERYGFIKTDDRVIQFTSKRIRTIGGQKYLVYQTPFIGIKYVINKIGTEYWAHCNTVKQGLFDIRFKEVDRDMSQYEDLTLEDTLSYEDAIIMYRVITGACQAGTEQFLLTHKIKERDYTLKEIIELTEGQYGSETLKEFLKGERK